MGDRVLMQCHDKEDVGVVIYGHWSGSSAPEAVGRFVKRMATRPNYVEYASARLLQELMQNDCGNTGFGVMVPRLEDGKFRRLDESDSHGDAGVILIDVSENFKAKCFGGYLRVKEDGSIVSKYDEEESDA